MQVVCLSRSVSAIFQERLQLLLLLFFFLFHFLCKTFKDELISCFVSKILKQSRHVDKVLNLKSAFYNSHSRQQQPIYLERAFKRFHHWMRCSKNHKTLYQIHYCSLFYHFTVKIPKGPIVFFLLIYVKNKKKKLPYV